MLESLASLDHLFSLASVLAMTGWAGLVLLPGNQWVVGVYARLLIPALIAVLYIYLMATHISSAPADGGFGSIAEIQKLFTVEGLLLAGWVHYLAFDLFVGSWEVEDARTRGITHLLVIPCLALTLLAGPAGLLVYLILRQAMGSLKSASGSPPA